MAEVSADHLRPLLAKAAAYLGDRRFREWEVDDKLAFEGALRPVIQAFRASDTSALPRLTGALQRHKIVAWRQMNPFLDWCKRRPSDVRTALRSLWFDRGSLDQRFRQFAVRLNAAGMTQPGTQLSITSMLLMGLGAERHPQIQTEKFRAVFNEAGYPPFERDQDAAARYAHAIQFLDFLLDQAPRNGVHLQHRLEAQGIVWCLGGGWKSPPRPTTDDGLDEEETARLIAAENTQLTETEKRALVLSRRGQGQFRNGLLKYWEACAVTGCRDTRLLRASHLKPWKPSTNSERLDPFNGLLLAPHLDTALDCGLITFSDDGKIRLSTSLLTADCKCLGIRRGMRLREVDQRHRPYLKFHRQNVYRAN